MKELIFEEIRRSLRHKFAELPIAELRAMKNFVVYLNEMFPYQRQYLIDDLTLLEHYKTKNVSDEEWKEIVKEMERDK